VAIVLRNAFEFAVDLKPEVKEKKMNNKLYVGNLAYSTDEAALRGLFSQAGTIRTITIPMDRMTNEPRGFAFVEMESPAEALKAIQMCNGQELDGRELRVNEAKPMEARTGGFGGGGGGNRAGGGRSNGGNRRY
jgi:RNA recognition motif-containing protein